MRTRITLTPSANVLVGNYPAGAEHIHCICDSANAAFTVQLPDVALPEHKEFVVYNQPSSGNGNDVTFVAVTGQTIKITDTQHILAPGDSVTFVADLRNNWLITDVNVASGVLVEYADNAAAIAAGLAVGRYYRNGDFVCVVH